MMIQSKINTSLSLQEVYIAKNDILPRSCIEEKDLLYVRYPQAFIDHNVVIKKKISLENIQIFKERFLQGLCSINLC